MKRVFAILENLSIVPVLVTLVNSVAFYYLQGELPNILAIIALACICWCIYIVDGILDVTKFEYESIANRHLFIKKHQFNLSVLIVAILFINVVLLFFHTKEVLLFGSFTASLVLIYLTLINKFQRFRLKKELYMPIIFTLATVGIPLFQKTSINLSSWILAFIFYILTFQNALIISWFEHEFSENKKNIFNSINKKTGKRIINYSNIVLIAIYMIFFSNGTEFKNLLALLYMTIGLMASFCITQSSKLKNTYRLILDSLLLIPFILLIFYFWL
jgi:hypothetical protein